MESNNSEEHRAARDNENEESTNGNENIEATNANENGGDQQRNEKQAIPTNCIHFTIRGHCVEQREAEDLPPMQIHKSNWWACVLNQICQLTGVRFVHSSLPVSREVEGAEVQPMQDDVPAPTSADTIENGVGSSQSDVPIQLAEQGKNADECPPHIQPESSALCPEETRKAPLLFDLNRHPDSPVAADEEDEDKKDVNSDRKGKRNMFEEDTYPVGCCDSPPPRIFEYGSSSQQPQISLDNGNPIEGHETVSGQSEEDVYTPLRIELPPPPQFEQALIDTGNPIEGHETVSSQAMDKFLSCLPHLLSYLTSTDNTSQTNNFGGDQGGNGSDSNNPMVDTIPSMAEEMTGRKKARLEFDLNQEPDTNSDVREPSVPEEFLLIPEAGPESDGSGQNRLMAGAIQQRKNTRGKGKGATAPKSDGRTAGRKLKGSTSRKRKADDINPKITKKVARKKARSETTAPTESDFNREAGTPSQVRQSTAPMEWCPKSDGRTAGRKLKGNTSSKRKAGDINPKITKKVARKKARSETTAPTATESDFNREAGTPSQVRQSTAPMEWRPNGEAGTSSQVRESRARVLLDLNREPGTEVCTVNRNPADFNPPDEDEDEYDDGENTMRW